MIIVHIINYGNRFNIIRALHGYLEEVLRICFYCNIIPYMVTERWSELTSLCLVIISGLLPSPGNVGRRDGNHIVCLCICLCVLTKTVESLNKLFANIKLCKEQK